MLVRILYVLCLCFIACSNPSSMKEKSPAELLPNFDWQGHRGARGILPENTIPAFLKALSYPIKTLELDVVVSKNEQIIVSHEPWMSHHICNMPDGRPVLEAEEDSLLIYNMDYQTIQDYDCGSRGNERFAQQQKMKVHKPSFAQMVKAIELHCQQNKRALPYYNVELKSRPSWYGTHIPEPEKFVELMLKEVNALKIQDRTNLQCFDLNVLKEIHRQDSTISTALLIEDVKNFDLAMAELAYTPPYYSPYFLLLTKEIIQTAHDKGMKVIPWTVNEPKQMLRMIDIGVDGLITDYPDRIEGVLDSLRGG